MASANKLNKMKLVRSMEETPLPLADITTHIRTGCFFVIQYSSMVGLDVRCLFKCSLYLYLCLTLLWWCFVSLRLAVPSCHVSCIGSKHQSFFHEQGRISRGWIRSSHTDHPLIWWWPVMLHGPPGTAFSRVSRHW